MSVGEKMNPLPSRQNGQVVVPNAVLGVMGGGQLGAMFAAAARRMGYRGVASPLSVATYRGWLLRAEAAEIEMALLGY